MSGAAAPAPRGSEATQRLRRRIQELATPDDFFAAVDEHLAAADLERAA